MDWNLKQVIEKLTTDGYIEFMNVVPESMLFDLNLLIDKAKEKEKGFKNFIGEDVLPILSQVRSLKEFNKIEELSRQACKEINKNFISQDVTDKSFFVLRCVDSSSDSVSHKRHYDSHFLTILTSIKTSNESGINGDLIIYPNNRVVKGAIFNVIQKTLTKFHQLLPLLIREKITAHDLSSQHAERIHTKRGSVYVFNGHITMHCNLNVEKGERRSLLIHDYDSGLAFGVSDFLRDMRRKKSLLPQASSNSSIKDVKR